MTNIGSPAISNMMQYGTRNAPGGEKVEKMEKLFYDFCKNNTCLKGVKYQVQRGFFPEVYEYGCPHTVKLDRRKLIAP